MAQCILIADSDPGQRRVLEEIIKEFGYHTRIAATGKAVLDELKNPGASKISLVILDLLLPDRDGIALLQQVRDEPGCPPIIAQTAQGGVETAIRALRAGAADFIVKPAGRERLEVSIKNALKINALEGEISRIQHQAAGKLSFSDFTSASPEMQRVIALGKRAAASAIPVLLEGESGVGKELIARAIQGEGERAGKTFVTVNCGSIPENLMESFLFGREQGAFAGATARCAGKFAEADGGTLFLDEIGGVPFDVQAKLLGALQNGEIISMGARRPLKADVRLIFPPIRI